MELSGVVLLVSTTSGKLPEWYIVHVPLLGIVHGKMYHGLHKDEIDSECYIVDDCKTNILLKLCILLLVM